MQTTYLILSVLALSALLAFMSASRASAFLLFQSANASAVMGVVVLVMCLCISSKRAAELFHLLLPQNSTSIFNRKKRQVKMSIMKQFQ